jgi:hypothetical protein
VLAAEPEDALGGRRSAKRLVGKVGKTQELVERSRTSPRAVKFLGKAARQMRSFSKRIAKLLATAKIEENLAIDLLDLAEKAGVRIEGLRAPVET